MTNSLDPLHKYDLLTLHILDQLEKLPDSRFKSGTFYLISSIRDQMGEAHFLSPKQKEVIEKVARKLHA